MNKILIGIFLLILIGLSTSLYFASEKEAKIIKLSETEELKKTNESENNISNVVVNENKGNTLDLSRKNLTKVPADIFSQQTLTELNLSNNKLEGSLPAEVRLLQELRILDLSNNDFTGLPAEVGQLVKLEVLNLANNKLTGLPLELGNLKSIQKIDLRGNEYAKQDLAKIREQLGNSVTFLTD